MPKEDHINIEGTVSAANGGGQYSVLIKNGTTIKAVVGGKMKRYKIRIIVGDQVTVAVSPYDPTHGFIMLRQRV